MSVIHAFPPVWTKPGTVQAVHRVIEFDRELYAAFRAHADAFTEAVRGQDALTMEFMERYEVEVYGAFAAKHQIAITDEDVEKHRKQRLEAIRWANGGEGIA